MGLQGVSLVFFQADGEGSKNLHTSFKKIESSGNCLVFCSSIHSMVYVSDAIKAKIGTHLPGFLLHTFQTGMS